MEVCAFIIAYAAAVCCQRSLTMPLQIVQHRYTANPGIACDHCGEAITSAADGNYLWRQANDGEASPSTSRTSGVAMPTTTRTLA